jgi:hypothetical protein
MLETNGHFSTLAVKSCYCETDYGLGEESDGNTQPCCDQWENEHAPGVKYSGSFDDAVRTSSIYKALRYDTTINLSDSVLIPIT